MIVFRLGKGIYIHDLSGRGAEKAGGRWNSRGIPMLYTSASRALCTTEIAVHTPLGNIPVDYHIISIEIPDDIAIAEVPLKDLPKNWRAFPYPHSTQKIGDKFIADNQHLVLKVSSVVVQGEYNYLLNPNHRLFKGVNIKLTEPFTFDERLFKK